MRGTRTARIGAMALAVLLTATLSAMAQLTTGSLTGTVKDMQGGVIPGATVTLISESRGTRSTPMVTNGTGDFVFPVVATDTYTIEVTMPAFKTLKRTGIAVSPGSRIAVEALTIEVGGATEIVDVKGETPLIQAASGERSFTIPTDSVENLPLANRGFTTLASLAPGVTGTQKLGALANQTTVMMDGVSTMDTGSNGTLFNMNVESIAEVKVLVSGYQAEYGRSVGLQITAVSKSGTNRFRGSLYNVRRNSDWNANSKTNILNGNPKPILKQQEIGYSIGGPVGKPGSSNKLFFFFAQEWQPRTGGNDVQSFRMPTALERDGDFSQTLDNNGTLYPYIKDPNIAGVCSAVSQVACFADGGVVGKIPANRLYQPGLNILRMFPMPTSSTIVGRNLEYIRPPEDTLLNQPALRFDYQPTRSLRISAKYQGQRTRRQILQGSIPGWNDAFVPHPVIGTEAVTVNYNINASTFLEGTYGRAGNQLAQNGLPVNPPANKLNDGLADLPLLFPQASVLNPSYYAYAILQEFKGQVPYWDGTTILKPPNFSWGGRIVGAPPNINYPGFININTTQDVSISLTKVAGRHTLKTGFYNTHSLKRENNVQGAADNFGSLNFQQDTVGTNAFDTSFGFANAAIGSFSSYAQASKYVEGTFNYNNTEWYVQDNWKVSRKLTLDYGVRFVHAQPQYDSLGQGSNFLPDKWSLAEAPMLYVPGCVGDANPCSGTNRQAKNPLTGALLGPNTTLAIGTIVPNSGNLTNGLFQSGKGIAKTTYTFPNLNVGPRVGVAYDITGKQKFVLRGAFGMYFDRPRPGDAQALVGNPPASQVVTVRFGQLQSLGTGGLTTQAVPGLTVFQYDAKLPTSVQFSGGVQTALPWSIVMDLEYSGLHSYNDQQPWNLNSIDIGTAFLASNQDLTLPASATPGATSFAATSPDLARAYRGYASMASTSRFYEGWRTYHSLQFSFNRRFKRGFQLGFNDAISYHDVARIGPRFDHKADGSVVRRADEVEAQKLLGDQAPTKHIMKGSFVWDLPDIKGQQPLLRAVGIVVNDWQLSGIWTGLTGAAYTVSQSYASGGSNVNLTGSPDFGARIRIVGDPGSGCNNDDVNRQFNQGAFAGPLVGSVGLESGTSYLHGCFSSTLDLAIARNIRLPKGRNIQLRADMFNAPNNAQITGRNTSMGLLNPNDPVTLQNSPFLADGSVNPTRVRPNSAGFGAVNGYQSPRTVQVQLRFSF